MRNGAEIMNDYSVVFGAGAAAAYLIKFLQHSKYFPWITAEAAKVNTIVQAAISFLVTIGITFKWDPQAHTLMIGGLSLALILHGLWTWFTQFAVQHGFTNLITIGQTLQLQLSAANGPQAKKATPAPLREATSPAAPGTIAE